MHLSSTLLYLSLTTGSALAAPVTPSSRATSGQNVVYWGQNGGGIAENNDLATYCTPNSGIDIIVLAFLYAFGGGQTIPSGSIGQSCYISTSGEGQNCDSLTSAITKCQSLGVKVLISLGGAQGSYSLDSQSEAEIIGQYMWDSYANSGNSSVQRPFGDVFVNGFDFDIELNRNGNTFYPSLISKLRSNFASDPHNEYYITGAPQCPLPEPNMGMIISNATFDYLWVQWYNNNNYSADPCSLGFNGNAPLNYDRWVSFISKTPSSDAKIFFGVPGGPLAANGAPSGETYYITPSQVGSLVSNHSSDSAFGGVMIWDSGFSDNNVDNNCTFAQQVKNILMTGDACLTSGPDFALRTNSLSLGPTATYSKSGSMTATSASTGMVTNAAAGTMDGTTTGTAVVTTMGMVAGIVTGTVSETAGSSAAGSVTSSVASTGVAQYAQCGGEGYEGPTQCMSPYTCVANSNWYWRCV